MSGYFQSMPKDRDLELRRAKKYPGSPVRFFCGEIKQKN